MVQEGGREGLRGKPPGSTRSLTGRDRSGANPELLWAGALWITARNKPAATSHRPTHIRRFNFATRSAASRFIIAMYFRR
jgi:hypothetical protein